MFYRDTIGIQHASRLWALKCMDWHMGKGAWTGLRLRFTRNWLGKRVEYAFPRDAPLPLRPKTPLVVLEGKPGRRVAGGAAQFW